MSGIIRSYGKFGWNTLLILLLVGMTPGCTVMERLRMKPMEEPSVSNQAQHSLQRRTAELAGIEEEAAGGAPIELARARTLLEEMDYFFQEEDYAQVNRLDSAMGESLDSIRGVLEAGGSPLSRKIAALKDENNRLRDENKGLRAKASGEGSAQRELQEEILTLRALSRMETQSFSQRLAVAEKERDDAIREVVRTRSRIEGLASLASASAMYAEARVLVDRMEEEAFSARVQGLLTQGQGYLESGKKELDAGNPGGAAYLFDLVSSIYQDFRDSEPTRLTITVRKAALYKSASSSSGVVGSLSQGDTVQGLQMSSDWVQVRDSGGRIGWVRSSQVR